IILLNLSLNDFGTQTNLLMKLLMLLLRLTVSSWWTSLKYWTSKLILKLW
ncbi:hypothetical protein Golob_004237, partial [Gossypium lobatum]|nr:hypothetical protein [Gossypium lobatum]